MYQKTLRLSLPHTNSEPDYVHRLKERLLNSPSGKVPPPKLLADLLKRLARRICSDITECPADSVAAHLARLDDLRELFGHHLRHDLRETAESSLSGLQLAQPHTLADWLAVLDITRRSHRAPSYINSRDEQWETVNRKLDLIAGMLSTHPLIEEISDISGQTLDGFNIRNLEGAR